MRKTRGSIYPVGIALAAMLAIALVARPAEPAGAHAGDSFRLSASEYTVTEGNNLIITVLKTETSPQDSDHLVTLSFTDGTALNGTHYGQTQTCNPQSSAQFAILDSQSSATFSVRACDDAIDNLNRTFTVSISSVTSSGTIGTPASATVTILDNDGPQPATITSISPTNGTTAGGTIVTINGSGFTGTDCDLPGLAVEFDGIDAASCSVNQLGTVISATSPPHAAGQVEIVVNNGHGPSIASPSTANDFTYLVPGTPFITLVNPGSGIVGQSVTITGGNFASPATVTFNGVLATNVVVQNSSTLSAMVPDPGSATRPLAVGVVVTSNAMASAPASFTYADVAVTGLTPSSGPPGISITISGTGFVSAPTVSIGGINANVISFTATTIVVTVPDPTTATRPITRDVLVSIGATSSVNTSADDFTYVAVVVTDISPDTGPPGTVVTIVGSGFMATPTVRFGTAIAVVNTFTPTSISAVAPAGASTVDVTVTVGSVTSDNTAADNFLYTMGVTVTNLDPNKGPISGGNLVRVTGSGFLAGATITVSFGGTAGTSVTRISDTELTVVAPARAAGVVSVIVTVNGAQSPNGDADDYTYAALPVITSMSPTSGAVGGTTIVTIIGLNFTEGAAVRFGAVEAVRTIVSETEIRAVAPSTAPPGTVNVTVTNAAGTSATGAHTIFTFIGSGGFPVVTSLSPNSAALNASGVEVTITGSNFATPATVKFGGVDATNVQVLSATQIRATAPARGTSGVVDVTVTTAAGTSSASGTGNDFTYGAGGSSGQTTNYQLFARFTLITWDGQNNMPVADALRGQESPDNPSTNNVFSVVTAVFYWSDTGAGCPAASPCWLGFFPDGLSVPGANNLATLVRGNAYWIAVATNAGWTVLRGQ